MPEPKRQRAYISLGSNIDRERNLISAVEELAARVSVVALSAVYQTAPVGGPPQEDFLNAAVAVESGLSPEDLKRTVLASVEAALGRVRTADKNAPRTIDLDIVAIASGAERPAVVDPAVWTQAHLAVPLADLLPDLVSPTGGEPLRAVAARLARAGGIVRRDDLNLRPRGR